MFSVYPLWFITPGPWVFLWKQVGLGWDCAAELRVSVRMGGPSVSHLSVGQLWV